MYYTLYFLFSFCFTHIVIICKAGGVWNKFTKFGHIWDAPKYEVHGMITAIVLGLVSFYLGIRY
jgi:hypothetical protein